VVQFTTEGGFAPRLSPDGKYFHYLRSRATGGLRRIPVGGGTEEDLLASILDRTWVATADGIHFFQPEPGATAADGSRQRGELLFYDVRSKRVRKTGFITPRRLGYSGMTISPDGKYLVYPQLDELGSEIMLVEHFR
jgi:hypothetical protein